MRQVGSLCQAWPGCWGPEEQPQVAQHSLAQLGTAQFGTARIGSKAITVPRTNLAQSPWKRWPGPGAARMCTSPVDLT